MRQRGMPALIKTGSGLGGPSGVGAAYSLRSRRWRGSKPDGAQRLVAQAKRDANAPHSSCRVVQAKLHSRRDQDQNWQERSRNAVSHPVSDAGRPGRCIEFTTSVCPTIAFAFAFAGLRFNPKCQRAHGCQTRLGCDVLHKEACTANTSHTPSGSPPRP